MLLTTVRAQLLFAPEDFFQDELSADNFVRRALVSLATHAHDAQPPLAAPLAEQLSRLFRFVRERFGLDIERLRDDELEDDEAPTIVET